MNRIKQLFSNDSKKLIVFITAGFPEKDSTKDLVLEAIKGVAIHHHSDISGTAYLLAHPDKQ